MKRDVTPLPPLKKSYHDLNLGVTTVKVGGPAEAVFLARLWDFMLCDAEPRRRFRASGRTTNWTAPYVVPSDAMVQRLVETTRSYLPPHLFPRLWAPLLDPATGELVPLAAMRLDNITRYEGIRIPQSAVELWNMKMNRARFNFPRGRRGFPLRDVGCLPGLEVEMPSEPLMEVYDPQGRIHCPHGPAVVHPDGTPEFYWRGTRVPSSFIPISDHWRQQYPDVELIGLKVPYRPLTPEAALQVTNTEVRRAACEIVGWHKILEDLHAVVIDKDPDPTVGELLIVNIPGEFSVVQQHFLRVRCGTGRTFALAVPDSCRTALEANAWTYGLSPEEYRPEIRT